MTDDPSAGAPVPGSDRVKGLFGTFRVQRRRCSSCIYRRDSLLDIEKLEDEVRDPKMGFAGYRACHHARGGEVCCRGFWDRHRDEFQAGQIAQRLGLVEFVTVDDFEGEPLWNRRRGYEPREDG